jgi:hypothetical protein
LPELLLPPLPPPLFPPPPDFDPPPDELPPFEPPDDPPEEPPDDPPLDPDLPLLPAIFYIPLLVEFTAQIPRAAVQSEHFKYIEMSSSIRW